MQRDKNERGNKMNNNWIESPEFAVIISQNILQHGKIKEYIKKRINQNRIQDFKEGYLNGAGRYGFYGVNESVMKQEIDEFIKRENLNEEIK